MDSTLVRIAESARLYDLEGAEEWREVEAMLGPAKVFAIESLPLTYEMNSGGERFQGRARVLMDVLDPEGGDFVESRVLEARIEGSLRAGAPRIERFRFTDV